ncbi:MAG: heavy metal translocating P-type ATPase, partial [Lapillicoccus sp.]
ATSGALEAWATRRTQESVTALLDLAPDQATVVAEDGGLTVVAAASVSVGQVVLVRPGERIPADGVVVDGNSEVDQSSITGESLPAAKAPDSEVFAGTMNGTGALRVEVTVSAGESVIARIVSLVEKASATKATTQLFIEKIEQRYSILMVTATIALFAVPMVLGQPFESTLLRAITFMIVASPCAVVLATMPPLLSAIANAGRHGVLVKSSVVMEQLGQTDTVILDKTGTLTEGRPRLAHVDLTSSDRTVEEILTLAAAAELGSQHPLGAAIVEAAQHRGLTPLPTSSGFESLPGQGVRAYVGDHLVQVLAPNAHPQIPAAARDHLDAIHARGGTAVLVVVDGRVDAVLGLHDALRKDAHDAVRRMAALTSHPPILLTGDNEVTARRVGHQVGISRVGSQLLPQDKARTVTILQEQGRRVLLVGDGVNDAPAMATAHLGVAMGRRGSDLALQTADAVIVRDELSTIPVVIALSRRARRVVTANLAIAATVIVALVSWDLIGHLPLPLAVAGHEGSTVFVGLNGIRLLRAAAWRQQ